MTLQNEGLNRTRDLVSGDIDKFQLGTDGTAPTADDGGLLGADATTLTAVVKVNTDKQTKFTSTLLSTSGSTNTYKEHEHLRSTAPVTHYDRITFTGISFVNGGTKDLIFARKYFYKSV